MDNEQNYRDVKAKLDAKLNRADVSTRKGGGQSTLSYVSSHYVIDKLNEVLGQGNWSYDAENVINVHTGKISTNYGDSYTCHYICKVRLNASIGGKSTFFSDYGYGDGTDKNNPGKAHELAIKEAVTDGLKRCAKNLGPVLGLALYDKEQEDVQEESNSGTYTTAAKATSYAPPKHGPVVLTANPGNDVKSKIKKAALEIVKTGSITAEEFKKQYLSGKRVDDMNDAEAIGVFMHIGAVYPQVKQLQ